MISISGVFSVTFSIVFAYVADVTTDEDRSAAYGLVSTKQSLIGQGFVPGLSNPWRSLNTEILVIAILSCLKKILIPVC